MLFNLLYILLGIGIGFAAAWVIQLQKLQRQGKELKSASGYLESEKLMKENLQKELAVVHQHKMATELELSQRLQKAEHIIRQMDSDILLLQKSNEETEELLAAKHPEVHALKIQLLEAQNTIARLKGKLSEGKG